VTATRTTEAPAPPPGYERRSAPLRTAARMLGDLLLTAGVVILLFFGYQLFYSNLDAGRAQARVTAELQKRWAAPPVPGERVSPGDGFARIHLPRLGTGWARPIVEGVGPTHLATGVGHYPTTAWPGRLGNFALAGHRATHGEPFRDLDRLRKGDAVVIETRNTWYVYEVDAREIVSPSQIDVLAPVPRRPGAKPTERLITLSTCNPRWASYERLIIYGHLTDTQPRSAGRPAVLG
jgi:sortase A